MLDTEFSQDPATSAASLAEANPGSTWQEQGSLCQSMRHHQVPLYINSPSSPIVYKLTCGVQVPGVTGSQAEAGAAAEAEKAQSPRSAEPLSPKSPFKAESAKAEKAASSAGKKPSSKARVPVYDSAENSPTARHRCHTHLGLHVELPFSALLDFLPDGQSAENASRRSHGSLDHTSTTCKS